MSFFRRVTGLSLRDRVRSFGYQGKAQSRAAAPPRREESVEVVRDLVRMPPGRLPGEVFRAYPSGRRPWGGPRTCWRDYILCEPNHIEALNCLTNHSIIHCLQSLFM